MLGDLFGQMFGAPRQQATTAQPPEAVNSPPPASKNFIANLPLVNVTADDLVLDVNNKECIICFEEHEIGATACKLNCGHLFHPECLKDWLQKQASCPICRYELETDDKEYEILRKKRMRERNVRFRKDELMVKSVKELRELLAMYNISSSGCFDKLDLIDRFISSGKVSIIEGVPTMDMTREELDGMTISEIKKLLKDFGLTSGDKYKRALEKQELLECLLDSNRINLVVRESKSDGNEIGTDNVSTCNSESEKEEEANSTLSIEERNDVSDDSAPVEDEKPIVLDTNTSEANDNSSSDALSSWSMKDLMATAKAFNINLDHCIEREDVAAAIRAHPDFANQR